MNTRQRHAKQGAACLALRAAAVMVAALLVSPPPQTYLPEPATLQDAVDCSTSTGWEPAATTPAAFNVQWPMDSCDHSKPDTASALAALTVLSSTPVPKEGINITP